MTYMKATHDSSIEHVLDAWDDIEAGGRAHECSPRDFLVAGLAALGTRESIIADMRDALGQAYSELAYSEDETAESLAGWIVQRATATRQLVKV